MGLLANCSRPVDPSSQAPTGSQKVETKQPTLQEQAGAVALDSWKVLLSRKVTDKNAFATINLHTEIANPNIWNDESLRQILISNKHPNGSLLMRFFANKIPDPEWVRNNYAGTKWIGEIEFDNVKVLPSQLSQTDEVTRRNTGAQWRGGTTVQFLSRGRSIFTEAFYDLGKPKNLNAFESWIFSSQPDEPLPAFQNNWAMESWTVNLTHNGTGWTADPQKTDTSGGPMLVGFYLPSRILAEGGKTLSECTSRGPSCRRTKKNL